MDPLEVCRDTLKKINTCHTNNKEGRNSFIIFSSVSFDILLKRQLNVSSIDISVRS